MSLNNDNEAHRVMFVNFKKKKGLRLCRKETLFNVLKEYCLDINIKLTLTDMISKIKSIEMSKIMF